MKRKTGLPACVAGKKNYVQEEMTPERIAEMDKVFARIAKIKKSRKDDF